uniref:Uncharacterized protein n=1 Tax=Megaselia scalaris TaxID=36166 RepID=T1GPW8_MEGSC
MNGQTLKRAQNAFYTCKKVFGTMWGRKPHMMHWYIRYPLNPKVSACSLPPTNPAIYWNMMSHSKSQYF